MRPPLPPAVLAALSVLLAAPAGAHGTYEASELEVHAISDEGSDAIEPYGGYDVQEIFVGFAHDPSVGVGPEGDGFYLRAELYGLPENAVQPPGAEWTVTFTVGTPLGPLVRTLATTDGAAFTHDFDALLLEVEAAERATHVHRAFVSFASSGLRPGDAIGPFLVESRVSGDLRDVAPGGIPVPGTNGAATYPDPTQIDGRGALVESVALQAPTGYVTVSAAAVDGEPGRFDVTAASRLAKGGQHIMVAPRATDGWNVTFTGTTNAAVEANGSVAFTLRAVPLAGASPAPLEVDVLTDVGGRSPLLLGADGALVLPDGASVAPAAAPEPEAPGPGLALLGLGLLAVAWARRAA